MIMLSEVDLKFMKEDELIVAGNGLGNAAARFVRNTHHDGRIKTWKGYPWTTSCRSAYSGDLGNY